MNLYRITTNHGDAFKIRALTPEDAHDEADSVIKGAQTGDAVAEIRLLKRDVPSPIAEEIRGIRDDLAEIMAK